MTWSKLSNQLNRDEWNQFVKEHGPESGRFLQSWEWGEFQGAERWVWDEKGVANVMIKKISGLGSYAYCPRGPVVEGEALEVIEALAGGVDDVVFFRTDLPTSPPFLPFLPFRKTVDVQPAHTWITDLSSSPETLLSSLHQKTRYNIKLSERHGVQIDFDSRSFDDVWPLFETTSGRGKFRLHKKQYYQRMLGTLRDGECHAHLVTALHEDKPIAANIMIDFAGVRTYLHGASSYEHRALMAPYLLHWFLLKDACEQGMVTYDWWGVAPVHQPTHPWAGITRFKKSFSGREVSYPGTYDLVKKPGRYKLYKLARAIRRL